MPTQIFKNLRYGQPLNSLIFLASQASSIFNRDNTETAPLGRLGCDTPIALANAIIDVFVKENDD